MKQIYFGKMFKKNHKKNNQNKNILIFWTKFKGNLKIFMKINYYLNY